MKGKNFLFIALVALLSMAAARFCHHQTKGFRLTKIQNNLEQGPCIAPPLSDQEIDKVRALFAYPFRYFGRGHQSFVFLSEDEQHVIKIFNNGHQRKITFFQLLAHLPLFKPWAHLKALHWENKLEKTFESYRIAFDEMKDKTGLLCIHLSKTENLPPLTIIDPLNIHHRLDSNEVGFLIQKRAKLAYPALEELIAAQDMERAQKALCSLIDLFIWKCRHGIYDNDPLIRTNFGFLDDEVVQIDVGPLSRDYTTHDPERMREEIFRITASLKNWLSERSPELVVFLDQQLEERLSF